MHTTYDIINFGEIYIIASWGSYLSSSDNVLIASVEGASAHCADKASDVIDRVAGSHHQVMWQQALSTSPTFDAEPSTINQLFIKITKFNPISCTFHSPHGREGDPLCNSRSC
jgi:hypothetical protein